MHLRAINLRQSQLCARKLPTKKSRAPPTGRVISSKAKWVPQKPVLIFLWSSPNLTNDIARITLVSTTDSDTDGRLFGITAILLPAHRTSLLYSKKQELHAGYSEFLVINIGKSSSYNPLSEHSSAFAKCRRAQLL